ncbi:MAG: SDR family NAD(P)-dependent oxidoreductase [bacterium]
MRSQKLSGTMSWQLISKQSFLSPKLYCRSWCNGGGGAIVNVASMAARNGGVVSDVAYAASKTGVVGITRTLARQYGKKGIRVNAVAPSPILTEMISCWPDALRDDFVSRIPLGRLGDVDDVAKVVVFLAGSGAAYLTGVTLDVTGGLFMG